MTYQLIVGQALGGKRRLGEAWLSASHTISPTHDLQRAGPRGWRDPYGSGPVPPGRVNTTPGAATATLIAEQATIDQSDTEPDRHVL